MAIDIEDIGNPIGDNDLSSLASYYWRDLYKNYGFPVDLRVRSIDMWYDRMFYGRIDYDNVPVYPKKDSLKQLKGQGNHFTINFVADAWEDFREFIEESLKLGNMRSDTVYSSMEPQRSYSSLQDFYHRWNTNMLKLFNNQFMNTKMDRRIKDFKSFMKVYAEFSRSTTDSFPLTRESMVLSKWCPPSISGLIVEISTASHGDDEEKSKYISDINFNYVVKAAKRYGFKVDKNAPWRFVADLDSIRMKAYIESHLLTDKSVYDDLYTRAYENDLNIFKHYLVEWYNSYVTSHPYSREAKTKNCDNSTRTFLNRRKIITAQEVEDTIPQSTWVRLYLYIKAGESAKQWSQKKFDSVCRRTMDYIEHSSMDEALKYLYDMTKKPLTDGKIDAKLIKKRGSFNL